MDVCIVNFAILPHDDPGDPRVHDRHVYGLFARSDWLRLLREVGFEPCVLRDEWSRLR